MCDNKELLRVTFISGDKSGPCFHDIMVPCIFFEKYNLIKPSLCLGIIDRKAQEDTDIVFFQRQYATEALLLLRKLKAKGIPCIAHVDDNVWELPLSNPAYATYRGTKLERFQKIITEAHAVTTSTKYLRSKILPFNEKCYIFRNLVDPEIANYASLGRDNPDEIRIGWHGTPHHHDDILFLKIPLLKILEKYPQVKLIFMGYFPPGMDTWCPSNRWEYYSFVPTDAFYPSFANLDLDIGLAPLEYNNFNRGKTARKAQEYAILRISSILSGWTPYDEWTHMENCLKPGSNSSQEWFKAMVYLIENPQERIRLSQNAFDFVIKNHDINTYIYERYQTYFDIRKEVLNG